MPRAVLWYRFYCFAAGLMNLGLLGTSLWFIARHESLANELVSAPVVLTVGLLCAPLSILMAGVNFWLPYTRTLTKPWEVHMTNLIVGMGTCVLLPIALPVLICWCRPEVKRYCQDIKKL